MRIIIFLFIILLASCQRDGIMQQLEEIDSIGIRGGDKQALLMLEKIVPESINSEEGLAYYWLLKMRTEIRLMKDIKSATQLEVPINYYQVHYDKGKLARSYNYKAHILFNLGKLREAISCLKQAEELIKDDRSEAALAHNVYMALAVINDHAHEKELSLKYKKLSLQAAYQQASVVNIVYALMGMYVSYDNVNQQDSAIYYLNKCIPLVDSIPKNQRFGFYANIGNAYIPSDMEKATYYLTKSIDVKPNVFAYKGLARIYDLRGERENAREMWAKALQTDNKYLKVDVLRALFDSQREEGDYKTASETAMMIVALKDSIAEKEKKDDIRGLQEFYEQEQKAQEEQYRFSAVIAAVGSLLLLTLALLTVLLFRHAKRLRELRQTRKALEKYQLRLSKLKQEGKQDTKEVERLRKKIAELQAKQGTLLQNGRERYEEMMADGTTLKWSRNDFTDSVEYYRTIDPDFVMHMEQDYNHLSSKYVFFAILQHLGKSHEEIQHIMVISENTIRSYQSRIGTAKIG